MISLLIIINWRSLDVARSAKSMASIIIMQTHTLDPRERLAIERILDDAEREVTRKDQLLRTSKHSTSDARAFHLIGRTLSNRVALPPIAIDSSYHVLFTTHHSKSLNSHHRRHQTPIPKPKPKPRLSTVPKPHLNINFKAQVTRLSADRATMENSKLKEGLQRYKLDKQRQKSVITFLKEDRLYGKKKL